MARPAPPPTLIYDSSFDPEERLWNRLHERLRPGAPLRVIVHLKTGATYVGRLRYFNNYHMTLAAEGHLHDLMYRDIAHILSAIEAL